MAGESATGGQSATDAVTGTGAQGGTDPASNTGNTDGGTDTGQSAGTPSEPTLSQADFDRVKNQLSAADKRREEAEQRLAAIADKDKTELDRATERAKALETELAQTREQLAMLRLERTMLADAEWGADKWHDPEDIVARLHKAVKDQTITVADDGTPDIKQVRAFLKDTAEKRKYLVKETGTNGATPPASGAAVGAGDRRTGADQKSKDDELRRRYRIP
jgi:thiamine pyrophosphate-dependent acetolactate synthase large subunit-like protein